ncbi:hypothetical protein F1559_002767 [Cyanidiococcus yangmingshanensis]|uniref:Uncharacterized protein n=1 Tax=Cyanidiococcus yangmingshanensis TaxID=2690220 RepID=A0A7J7ILJ8_9RHOD|nr:hypothetical protein F1559_002767 [Cyanidiococcus yangmingshanensis]
MVTPALPLSHRISKIITSEFSNQDNVDMKGIETPMVRTVSATEPCTDRAVALGGTTGEQVHSWRSINRLLGQAGFQALPLDAGLQATPTDTSVRLAFAQVLAEYERRGQLVQSLLGETQVGDDRTRVAEAALMELEQALLKSNQQIAWLKSKLLKYRAYIERKRKERREQQQQQQVASQPRHGRQFASETEGPQRETMEELRQLVADLQVMLHVPDHRLLPERIRQLQRDAENAAWLAEFADCVRSIVEEVLSPESHLSEEQVLDELERWAVERVSTASEPA